jgi:hypothetical protein
MPTAPEPDYTLAQVHKEAQIYNAVGEMPAGSLGTHLSTGPRK